MFSTVILASGNLLTSSSAIISTIAGGACVSAVGQSIISSVGRLVSVGTLSARAATSSCVFDFVGSNMRSVSAPRAPPIINRDWLFIEESSTL